MRQMPDVRSFKGLLVAALTLCCSQVAAAQAPGPGDPGQIERIAGGRPGGPGGQEGVRVVAPGALLWASFDRDMNGLVTEAEIKAGATLAFTQADRNADGQLTAFEQGDWAARIGAREDVLSNPMVFDADLDRSVTAGEFGSGLLRLAAALKSSEAADILLADLVKPLRAREERDEGPPDPEGVDQIARSPRPR